MWPMIAAAAGSIGGSILGYFGQRETNATNMAMSREQMEWNSREADIARQFNRDRAEWAQEIGDRQAREAMAFEADQAQKQMDFQAHMSSTAYQRQVQDMKAAGLNPMLAVMKGGGATTPSGAAASGRVGGVSAPSGPAAQGVTPARAENSLRFLGEALSGAANSSLSIANLNKDLEVKDQSVAVGKAQELSALAAANRQNADAAATKASMPSVEAKARAASAEADLAIAKAVTEQAKTEQERKFSRFDALTKRVGDALGVVTDAFNIKRLWQGSVHDKRDQIMKEETHMHRQGVKGTRLP